MRFFFLIFFLISCSTDMDIAEFGNKKPLFVLEDYFKGKVDAWGLFYDRFGNLKRQFNVKIQGTWDGKTLILDEKFKYDDGEQDQRIWKITKINEQEYLGEADDVVGKALGISNGNALNWSYELMLTIKEKKFKVKFDDWMFLQEKGVLINRAEISKFGINLGIVYITFLKS